MTKKYDFIKGDSDRIYFTPEFTRAMYFQTCRIVSDPNFKYLPLDEQHMWLKNKREMEKELQISKSV